MCRENCTSLRCLSYAIAQYLVCVFVHCRLSSLVTPTRSSRLLDVVLLLEQVALDLGVLQLLQVSFCDMAKSAHTHLSVPESVFPQILSPLPHLRPLLPSHLPTIFFLDCPLTHL